MGRPMTSDRPFQKLYMDLLGPYPRSKEGNIGVLIIVDHLSKFHFLQPLKKFISDKICDYLLRYVFYTFGVPESILTDNGSQFKSGQFEAFLTRFGIAQSNAVKKFSSKLAKVFILSKVMKKVSPAYFELANEKGKSIGIYHLKDIQDPGRMPAIFGRAYL